MIEIREIHWALLLAGLGLFMLGMRYLEQALSVVLNRSALNVLRKSTASLWLAIPFGAVLTALMQSSSLLGLLVLAFVGAGAMPMRHALGVMLGANLGTTLTGWLVTWLGFTLEIESASLPLLGTGALLIVLMESNSRWLAIGRLMLGFGLLLFGLDAMKQGVSSVAGQFDFAFLEGVSLFWFLLAGTFLAAIIQSSSAVIMLVLSGVYADVLPINAALAMVIGADVGTSSTLLLASLKGAGAKRQVAVFHLIYNLITAVLSFLLLLPLAAWIFDWVGVTDRLYQLVLFHSLFNFLGIFIMLPWLSRLAFWLENHVGVATTDNGSRYLQSVPRDVPTAALIAVRKESEHVVGQVVILIAQAFTLPRTVKLGDHQSLKPLAKGYAQFIDAYEVVKKLEWHIVEYSRGIDGLSVAERGELERYLSVVRSAVYAAKSIKDVYEDIDDLWRLKDEPSSVLRKDLAEVIEALLTFVDDSFLQKKSSTGIQQALEHQHVVAMSALQSQLYSGSADEDVGFSSRLNILREIDNCATELFRMMSRFGGSDQVASQSG